MTVSNDTNKAGPFVGDNAVTSFAFTYKVFAASDLTVILRAADGAETTLVYASDYTVVLNADQDASPGGSITYPISGDELSTNEYLTILRIIDEKQESDITNLGGFYPDIIENMSDRNTMMSQQHHERGERALRISAGSNDAQIASMEIPPGTTDKYPYFDADGLLTLVSDPTGVATGTALSSDSFAGDGSTVAFTLSLEPLSAVAVMVSIDGVTQIPTTDYSVLGTTITFVVAPPNLANIEVRNIGEVKDFADGDQIGLALWPRTASETAAGVTPTDYKFRPGDVLRYGAVIDGATDDTQAFNDAVQSGHGAFCNLGGTANIEGTIVLDGQKSFVGNGALTLERQSGAATTPMLHLYGNWNHFDGGGCFIRNDLYANPTGIVLIGPSLAETYQGTTDVQCYGNTAENFQLRGPENGSNPQDDGAPGIYVHSIRRKLYGAASSDRNPTYDTCLRNVEIVNCDVGIELSTDANRGTFYDVQVRQYKTAAVFLNASYGNQFFGLAFESPLAWTGSATERWAIHLMSQNSGVETDTDAAYAITQAYNNYFNCYCELPSASPSKGRLMNWDAETSANAGHNRFRGPMAVGAGFGKDGQTNYSGLGSNTVMANNFSSDQENTVKYHGWSWRRQDTDPGATFGNANGSSFGTDQVKTFTGRMAQLDESTVYDVITIDDLGPTNAGVLLKLSFIGRDTTNADIHAGEMSWMLSVTGDTVRTPLKIKDFQGNENDENVEWGVAASAGTLGAGYGKYILQLTTGNPAGTGLFYYTWKVEILHGQLLGNPLDWESQITVQNGG